MNTIMNHMKREKVKIWILATSKKRRKTTLKSDLSGMFKIKKFILI